MALVIKFGKKQPHDECASDSEDSRSTSRDTTKTRTSGSGTSLSKSNQSSGSSASESGQSQISQSKPSEVTDTFSSPLVPGRPSGLQSGAEPAQSQRLVLMRHAERVDRVFPSWLRLAFHNDQYKPYDLNQPPKLFARERQDYEDDTPITEMGSIAAQMIGRGLGACSMMPTAVYTSPALRCIQTAANVLRVLKATHGKQLLCRVEPGMFEWMSWYETPPAWIDAEQLAKLGLPVDPSYMPIMSTEQLRANQTHENAEQFQQRENDTLNKIMNLHPGGTVLVVGHAPTVDAARGLLQRGHSILDGPELERCGLNYPYCATVSLQRATSDNNWVLAPNALPNISYLDFSTRINNAFFNRA